MSTNLKSTPSLRGPRSTGRRLARLVVGAAVLFALPTADAAVLPISGNHRLFDRFAEDGAIVPRGWVEAGLAYDEDRDAARDVRFNTVIAFRFGRDVEAGLTAGAIDRRDHRGSPLYGSPLGKEVEGWGLEDATLYGKYRVVRTPFELALGGRITLPIADEGEGRGPGVWQYEAFLGMRRNLARVAFVGSIGVADRGDVEAPVESAGRRSLKLGAGALVPLSVFWTLVAEASYESARFEGEEAAGRAIFGFDWRPTKFLAGRAGVGAGFTNGAADYAGVLSVALLF